MDGGRQPCGLCKKSFASLSDWIPHYNSRHNDIYRSGVPGYFTCTRCLKFLVIEEESTHHCRRTAPTLRSTAIPGLSSPSTEGHPRGTREWHRRPALTLQALQAACRTPAATPEATDLASRPQPGPQPAPAPLRLALSAAPPLLSVAEKEGSGPPSSSGRDGGSQPPPSVGEVSSRSTRGVSGAPPRGVSGAPPRGVSSQPTPVVSGSNAGQDTREPPCPQGLGAQASSLLPDEFPARRSGRSSASARRIQRPESPSDPGSDPAGSLDSSFSDNNATD